jgi:hypothetical protein
MPKVATHQHLDIDFVSEGRTAVRSQCCALLPTISYKHLRAGVSLHAHIPKTEVTLSHGQVCMLLLGVLKQTAWITRHQDMI